MHDYAEMVTPLVVQDQEYYTEEVVPNDYFGQWIRGSEVLPSDVQQLRTTYGQYT